MGAQLQATSFKEVTIALYDALQLAYLRPPTTQKEWEQIANDFEELRGLPHCTGANDSMSQPSIITVLKRSWGHITKMYGTVKPG